MVKKLFFDMGMADGVAAGFVPTGDKNQPRPHIRLERAEMAASLGETTVAEAEFADGALSPIPG